jgi:polyhydroxyalkanoate synthesis regulator phasin
MNFLYCFLIVIAVVGYFCGVNQGRKDVRDEIKRIKERKKLTKINTQQELEFILSDEDKKNEAKRERSDRERLQRQIGQLEKEMVWIENLLSEI